MKSVDDHLADVLAGVDPLSPLQLQLLDAQGCVLAEDVDTRWPLPPFTNSAMDGYAVRAADVVGASESSPVELPVVGDIAAGSTAPFGLSPGQTMRIMTGAPLPAGADAVVPLEWTDTGLAQVTVRRAARAGTYVRQAGDDVPAGSRVVAAGTRLAPAHLGLIAAAGRGSVLVRPRPRVVVMSTGSELVEPGEELQPGQISDSNSFVMTAAARDAGALAFRVGIVPDEPRLLLDAIEDQLVRADLIVTTGGVSVGAYDVVKEALSRLGTVAFERVAMQPGMPQGFGRIGPDGTPFFGLPGNPVSAFVSFEAFVRPVIRRMLGAEPLLRPSVRAVALEPLDSPAGKRQFMRGELSVEDGRYVVRPVGGSASHLLAGLALANALIVVPEDVTHVARGDSVVVMMLERRST